VGDSLRASALACFKQINKPNRSTVFTDTAVFVPGA
jgi:hypothetical protein